MKELDNSSNISTLMNQVDPMHNVAKALKLVIVGAGPAGLTAAYQWTKLGRQPLVLEMSSQVGGIARTECYRGYRFDIGGHRFFTKVKEVEQLWREILGDDFIKVPRLSRIFYRGKFYNYPINLRNTLSNLGIYESIRILLSYFKWKVWPSREEHNFEQWVSNRFGGRLYWHFFRTYTEKVWGVPCTEIRSDWAAQRIQNLSLKRAVMAALTNSNSSGASTLIKEFDYPKLGPGMMWERCRDLVEANGGEVRMQTRVDKINLEGERVKSITTVDSQGRVKEVLCDHTINSMPISLLVQRLQPAAPQHVLDAASRLKYRDFLIVALIVHGTDPFPDNWIYIHSPEVKVGRIQNFRSWSKHMVPDENHASIGMEYFCHRGDDIWEMSNEDLIHLASQEIVQLGLVKDNTIVDGTVVRQARAYPVYDAQYKENLDIIHQYVNTIENLQTVGRNGMHRYNNQDHSMLTAMLAVKNILGEQHDLWNVNVERSYHEDFITIKKNKPTSHQSKAKPPKQGSNLSNLPAVDT